MEPVFTARASSARRLSTSLRAVLFCSGWLLLFCGQLNAQISMPGYTPPPQNKAAELPVAEKARRGEAPLSRWRNHIGPEAARDHRLPALDPREMRQERKSMRLRVGAIRAIPRPLDILNGGTVFQTPEGKLYLMRVATEGAAMTRLHFSQAALPAGARLFVYSRSNPDEYHALHIPGEDGLDLTAQSEFWTPPLTGEEVVIEYLAPTAKPGAPAEQHSSPFLIDQISHIFLDPRTGQPAESAQQSGAAACNNNVPAEWGEAAKSVGMLQFATTKGEFVCSGVLLNNARNDGTPYFLTANHCLSGMNFTSRVTVYWLYDGGDRPANDTPRTTWGTVIATGAAGDFTLLQLPSVPPGVRFAGWTAEAHAASTPVTSIHHPRASYKRFSAGQIIAGDCPPGLPGACEQYLQVRWQNGITEPGSSGAPLWTGSPADPRVAGLLSGGLSSCSNPAGVDFYGRFDLAFAAIAPYLTGQGCAFALEPVKQIFGSRDAQTQEIFSSVGGDGSVKLKVRSGTDCGWTARSEASWITLTSAPAGTGEATVSYTVAPHIDAQPRIGYLSVAGHRLLVRQMGQSNCAATALDIGQSFDGALSSNDCRSALDPRTHTDRYTFNAQAGQQIILAMSSTNIDAFLLLFGPDGKVIEYNDDRGLSPSSIIPGAGGHVELAADGAYAIEATSFEPGATGAYKLDIKRVCSLRFTQEPALIPAAGGNGQLNVAAPPACQWSAQSQANWLTINSGAGAGNGVITFTATPNPYVGSDNAAAPREGPLTVVTNGGGSSTPTVKQNYNCGFRVGPRSITINPTVALSESRIFTQLAVTTGATCQWTATSDAPWIEFADGGSSYTATGTKPVVYLKVNSLKFGNTAPRATLTVAGATVDVTIGPTGQLCPLGNLTVGQSVGDSLAPGCRSITGATGYVKQYKFQGRAGQRIVVLSNSLETGLRLWLRRMDGADGVFTASLTLQSAFSSFPPGTLRMPDSGYITLPADGAYFLEVSSYPAEASPGNGSFFLSVLDAPSGSCGFTISTNRQNLIAGGGRGSVSVNATSGNCAWTATTAAPWIKLAATTGNGDGALEYTVEPNTGAFRAGAIVVAGRHLIVTQQPANAPVVVSAADYAPNLATGAIQALFGSGLAMQTVAATAQPLPTTLGGTQVVLTTNGGGSYEAPLFFVSPNQINFQAPRGVPPGLVNITVKVNGQMAGVTRAVLDNLAPALFTADASGRGVPAAYALRVRRDGTRTEESIFDRDVAGRITPRPIRLADNEDVYLILYGTGFNGAPSAGAEVEATFLPDLKQKSFVVAAPGFAGLDQINLLLPISLRGRGDVSLTIRRDSVVSNPVTIRISGQ